MLFLNVLERWRRSFRGIRYDSAAIVVELPVLSYSVDPFTNRYVLTLKSHVGFTARESLLNVEFGHKQMRMVGAAYVVSDLSTLELGKAVRAYHYIQTVSADIDFIAICPVFAAESVMCN